MSATPLEARSDVTSLIAEDAVSYDDASLHDHTPAGLRHGQPRRRGWFLRRSLVIADAFAFLIAALGVGALHNGAHTLSHPPLVFGGLFAWITLSWLYGYYTQDELRMAHSTADDVPGTRPARRRHDVGRPARRRGARRQAAADQQARRLLRRARRARHRDARASPAWSCAAG